jgi:hypothetical protein
MRESVIYQQYIYPRLIDSEFLFNHTYNVL